MEYQGEKLMITVNIKTKLRDYFGADEFRSLLVALKNKYVIYESCVGSISLVFKTEDEALKVSKLLGQNFKVNQKYKIKVSSIQKSLDDSVFEGTTVDDLVLLFYPSIKSNKEVKKITDEYIDERLNDYRKLYEKSKIMGLFDNVHCLKRMNYLIIHDVKLLDNVLSAMCNLPVFNNSVEYLSLFATKITDNPHYYDLDTHESNIFLHFICYLFNLTYSNKRKDKIEVLEHAGILVDAVSNFVITYNLIGNEMLDSFKNNLTPLTLSLANLSKMDNIVAFNDTILVIENPSFISQIINKRINYSVIITSGNSNLVVYKLLEKIKSKVIYFNGDLDPEGLLIAQNFKDNFPNIRFVGYDYKYYYNGISKNVLTALRLKKLDNITDDDLIVVKDLLLEEQRASYQESNYNLILNDINELIGKK